jgi:hypothetical protein
MSRSVVVEDCKDEIPVGDVDSSVVGITTSEVVGSDGRVSWVVVVEDRKDEIPVPGMVMVVAFVVVAVEVVVLAVFVVRAVVDMERPLVRRYNAMPAASMAARRSTATAKPIAASSMFLLFLVGFLAPRDITPIMGDGSIKRCFRGRRFKDWKKTGV